MNFHLIFKLSIICSISFDLNVLKLSLMNALGNPFLAINLRISSNYKSEDSEGTNSR